MWVFFTENHPPLQQYFLVEDILIVNIPFHGILVTRTRFELNLLHTNFMTVAKHGILCSTTGTIPSVIPELVLALVDP